MFKQFKKTCKWEGQVLWLPFAVNFCSVVKVSGGGELWQILINERCLYEVEINAIQKLVAERQI